MIYKTIFACFILISCNNNSSSNISSTDTALQKNKVTAAPVAIDSSEEKNKAKNIFKLVPHPIHLQKGIDFDLNIPGEYDISIAAENMHRLRFLAKSPDSRLFLGLIGVVIAYVAGGDDDDVKRNRAKWAWIGVGLLVVIILALGIFGGGFTTF